MGRHNTNRQDTPRDPRRALDGLRGFARRFAGDKRANVLIMFGLMLPVLLALVGAGIDFSYGEDAKVQLQDATDAAALAVSAEVVKNPNETEATLQALAQSSLTANYTMQGAVTAPTITAIHICAPVQNDCHNGATTMANDTVLINTQSTAPCIPIPIPTVYCSGGSPPVQTVHASTTTVIGFGATLQLNIVMDTSASMIVGATAQDVTDIANWMSTKTIINEKCGGSAVKINCYHMGNWDANEPNNSTPDYKVAGGVPCFGGSCKGDNPPCAFACHDASGTTPADITTGLTNAHTAGATTRFDVMISAANQLISNIQSLLNANNNLAKNTYLFNVYGFDDSIHQYGTTNMPCTASTCGSVTSAIGSVSPGLNTYLNASMQTFSQSSGTNSIGVNGNGTSAASPLKFVILVTDGLQSDRGGNWGGSNNVANDPAWNYPSAATNALMSNPPGRTIEGGFDGPINLAYCTALKNEGVVLAVLETPYVPLDGQSPHVQPYEQTVRHTIYPGGPNGGAPVSVVSQALQTCATTGYYFQANSPSDISTGFTNLTTKFIQQHSYISQ
jgi:Flp pilus assembly protein TadG